MNNDRRKALEKLTQRIETISGDLSLAKEDLDSLWQEEQDYFDNMPENMQGGEKGEKAEAAADLISTAVDALDTAISECDDAIQAINEAVE